MKGVKNPSVPYTKETEYLGHFRKPKYVCAGHNSQKASDILNQLSSGFMTGALLMSMGKGEKTPKTPKAVKESPMVGESLESAGAVGRKQAFAAEYGRPSILGRGMSEAPVEPSLFGRGRAGRWKLR